MREACSLDAEDEVGVFRSTLHELGVEMQMGGQTPHHATTALPSVRKYSLSVFDKRKSCFTCFYVPVLPICLFMLTLWYLWATEILVTKTLDRICSSGTVRIIQSCLRSLPERGYDAA